MSSTVTSTLTIHNLAKYPLACLAIGYFQDDSVDGAAYTKSSPLIKVWSDLHEKTFLNDELVLEVENVPKHNDYWIIAWNCVYDTAVYYMVADPSFWHRFGEKLCKDIDKAIGKGIDAVTGTPVGTAWSTAANVAVNAIFSVSKSVKPSMIENKIDSDTNTIDIYINEDRLTGKIHSDGHTTNTSLHSYLYQEGDEQDKGYGYQVLPSQ